MSSWFVDGTYIALAQGWRPNSKHVIDGEPGKYPGVERNAVAGAGMQAFENYRDGVEECL